MNHGGDNWVPIQERWVSLNSWVMVAVGRSEHSQVWSVWTAVNAEEVSLDSEVTAG